MNELQIRESLSRMASDPAPPSTVDVDRAIAHAQQKRRRTQWMVIAAAAAVVLVVTLGVVTAFTPDDRAEPAPVVSAPPFGTAPQSFDPLNPRLEIGWLPSGLSDPLGNSAVTAEFMTYRGKNGTSVSVYAIPRKGGFPAVEFFGQPVDGPDINGQPSKWYQVPVPVPAAPAAKPGAVPPSPTTKPTRAVKNAGVLRWEWAKGGMAQVDLTNVKNPMDVAAKIARSVRLDRPKPFAMPLQMSKPNIPVVRTGATSESAIVEFASAGWKRPSMLVGVGKARTATNLPKPNVTLPGGRKIREDLYPGLSSIIFDFGPGAEMWLQCTGPDDTEASTVATKAECRRLAASATPVGTFTDPSTWTKSIFR
ncbi:hypothetical protein [Cryptosporangium sp. NPDC048952]|uniref:hypothetical protein n=1 Tax=Cryptosporangium sp. NPDC048952 TaxID=3363961 RepID=UPI00371BE1E6